MNFRPSQLLACSVRVCKSPAVLRGWIRRRNCSDVRGPTPLPSPPPLAPTAEQGFPAGRPPGEKWPYLPGCTSKCRRHVPESSGLRPPPSAASWLSLLHEGLPTTHLSLLPQPWMEEKPGAQGLTDAHGSLSWFCRSLHRTRCSISPSAQ